MRKAGTPTASGAFPNHLQQCTVARFKQWQQRGAVDKARRLLTTVYSGRLSRIDEIDGGQISASLQYSYDEQGHVVSETRSLNDVSYRTSYRYANGRLNGLTYPSGKQIDYARDAAGRISQVTLTDSGQRSLLASAIQYHAFGGIRSWTTGGGQVVSRSQDSDGRASGYTLGSSLWQVSYDPAGRMSNSPT